MFTGFATENLPSIQIWDHFRPTAGGTPSAPTVSLTDDCSPIQYFRTGSSTYDISLYLPTAMVEGRIITIINAPFTQTAQKINVYSSDSRQYGNSLPIMVIGQGETVTLTYSKNFIGPYSSTASNFATGWVQLDRSPTSAINSYSAVLSGFSNTILAGYCAIAGGRSNSITSGLYSYIGGGNGNTIGSTYATVSGGFNNNASGTRSTIGGGESNSASTTYATVGGGQLNTASGTTSVVAGGGGNSATQSYCATVGGQNNANQSQNSFLGGGYLCSVGAGGGYNTIGGGVGSNTYNYYTSVLGGNNNVASGDTAAALGGAYCTTRSQVGYVAITGGNAPTGSSYGYTQIGAMVLGINTTDATATALTADGLTPSTSNQLVPQLNSAIYFYGYVVATVSGVSAGNTKSWSFTGLVKKGASAATVAFVGTPTNTSPFADAGASTWTMAISLDTTNGAVRFTATGQAATNIKWVCGMRLTEVAW